MALLRGSSLKSLWVLYYVAVSLPAAQLRRRGFTASHTQLTVSTAGGKPRDQTLVICILYLSFIQTNTNTNHIQDASGSGEHLM